MTVRFTTFILLSLLISCIDPLKTDLEYDSGSLVVNAELHDLTEPNYVYLSRTGPFDSKLPEYVNNALVTVEDAQGNIYQFEQHGPGIYKICPEMFIGEVGMEYKLKINLSGVDYESEFSKMLPKGEIVDFFFEKSSQLQEFDDTFRAVPGIDFFIDFRDSENKDYYKIDYKGTFMFEANARDQQNDYCWKTESSDYNILLHDDTYTDNSILKRERVSFLEKGWRFKDGYSMEVRLKSLTPEAYLFWSLVEEQSSNDGSVFSSLPSRIKSNIKAVNSDENVLGFFTTTSIATERVYVPSNIYPDIISVLPGCDQFRPSDPIQEWCYDCSLYTNSSNMKPEFWP